MPNMAAAGIILDLCISYLKVLNLKIVRENFQTHLLFYIIP